MKTILNTSIDTIINYFLIPVYDEAGKIKYIDPEKNKKGELAEHKNSIESIVMYIPIYGEKGKVIEHKKVSIPLNDIKQIYEEIEKIENVTCIEISGY